MQLEMVGTLITVGVAVVSSAATVYFWLDRRRKEAPCLRAALASPVVQRTDDGERAALLTAFAAAPADDRRDVVCHYLLFEAEVVNASLLPNAVRGARAEVGTRDGGWQPFNLAFAPGEAHTDGPFCRLTWYHYDDGSRVFVRQEGGRPLSCGGPYASDRVRTKKDGLLPSACMVPLRPGEGARLQVALWVEVFLGDRRFEWARVPDDKYQVVRDAVTGPLSDPPRIRLVVEDQTGRVFSSVHRADEREAVTFAAAEPAPPPLPPVEQLAPERTARLLANVRLALARLARPDGDFGYRVEGETDRPDCLCDPDPVAYAAVLHRALGLPLPYPDATRRLLLARQARDGGFTTRVCWPRPVTSPAAALYSAGQALAGLHALGVPPRHDPLPAVEAAARALDLERDWGSELGPCVARAYRLCGRPMPADLEALFRDRLARDYAYPEAGGPTRYGVGERAYHAVLFERFLGRAPPGAEALLQEAVSVYAGNDFGRRNPNVSEWFAELYLLRSLGRGQAEAERVLAEAGPAFAAERLEGLDEEIDFDDLRGAIRSAGPGFLYDLVGTLVLAGAVAPAEPPSEGSELLGWGHAVPHAA